MYTKINISQIKNSVFIKKLTLYLYTIVKHCASLDYAYLGEIDVDLFAAICTFDSCKGIIKKANFV